MPAQPTDTQAYPLQVQRLGIDTHQEPVVYLHRNSHVCRSEGFDANTQVRVATADNWIIATLNIITNDQLLPPGSIGLSESAWHLLQADEGTGVHVSHPQPIQSFSYLRAKVYGQRLNREQMQVIINDIVAGRYADVHLSAFITACSNGNLDREETTLLTEAMVDSGRQLTWGKDVVVDKHCVGGLPGNRTTPIIVSIVTACGVTMPKTSSRAITSPAGTADTMATLTEVELNLQQMHKVVEQEGGCLIWGGSVQLSPADDLLIRVERMLDFDSEGQLVASVLSKKIAAGSTHVLIDMPVGPTAKVRSQQAADLLGDQMYQTGKALGLTVEMVQTDGSQPVGRGIGPALEARDILQVLQNQPQAPQDLRQRSLVLAARLLEIAGAVPEGQGLAKATEVLDNGQAWEKFQHICQAQGGLKQPPIAPYRYTLSSSLNGCVTHIDNRKLAQLAKLAGAPADPAAGVEMHISLKTAVNVGDPLITLHAESPGELDYAVEFLHNHPTLIIVE